MTTAQLEHLKLIDAHLERLLAIAEKRTPGEWTHEMQCDSVWSDHDFDLQIAHTMSNPGAGMMWDADQRRNNATYIASCAGNAEAGWRATRAAIDWLFTMQKHGGSQEIPRLSGLAEDVLSAFPLELIKP